MLDKLIDKLSNTLSTGTLFILLILSIFLTVLEFLIIGYLDDINILMFFISNIIMLMFIFSIFDKFFKKEKLDEPK